MYDYVIVGCGLYGSVFAHQLKKKGLKVIILERQSFPGGNVRSTQINDIHVHEYGPHIFHTQSKKIWEFVNSVSPFHHYQHKVKARYEDKIYTLPFNMSTYYEMWGCTTPQEAIQELNKQREKIKNPSNLEEQALSTIGKDLYQKLVYGYTKKQWQRDPKKLPASIIRRIPLRMNFNDNYFNDYYQGIPTKGYSHLIEELIDGVEVKLNCEFNLTNWQNLGRKLVYSGSLDELFNYSLGHLEYRGLEFKTEKLKGDFQGCSQMNYTSEHVPHTRIIEHKHFQNTKLKDTIVTYEYPIEWSPGLTRYYPINDLKNKCLYEKYRHLIKKQERIIIGGRLGLNAYLDMDQVVAHAITTVNRELKLKCT